MAAASPAPASRQAPAPCPIEVSTFDADGKLEKTKLIDHSDFDDRRWLSKHCWWALRNGRKVVTSPAANVTTISK